MVDTAPGFSGGAAWCAEVSVGKEQDEAPRKAAGGAETLGSRSASRRAAAKISKRSWRIAKPSKAAEKDAARCQKALEKENARASVSGRDAP